MQFRYVTALTICLLLLKALHLTNPQTIATCINNVLRGTFTNTLVHITDFPEALEFPGVRINTVLPSLVIHQNESPNGYIIDLRKRHPHSVFITLDKSPIFNPRATFIIIANESTVDTLFLSLLRKYHISNYIFLIEENFFKVIQLKLYLIGDCDHGFPKTSIEEASSLLDFNRMYLKITYAYNPPTSICIICEKGKHGIEIELANMIFDHTKVNYLYIRTNFTYWGDEINQIFTNAYGILQRRETNALLGSFHAREQEHYYFEQTFSALSATAHLIVPLAKKIAPWRRITTLLTPTMWLLCVVQFVFVVIIVVIISRVSGNPENLNTYMIVNYFYQVVTEAAPLLRLHTFAFRLIAISWLVQLLVFNTVLKSKLLSTLLLPEYEKQIRTLEEVAYSDLDIALTPYMRNMFREKVNPVERRIYERSKLLPTLTILEALAYTAEKPNRAIILNELSVKSNSHLMENEKGQLLLRLVEDPRVNFGFSQYFFERGHPLFLAFDKYLMILLETGHIFQEYQRVYVDYKNKLLQEAEERNILKVQPLILPELWGIFGIWIIGLFVSVIVFFTEVYRGRRSTEEETHLLTE